MALKPDTIRHFRVFLASPGDVENERQQVHQFFAEYNRTTASVWNVQFDVIDCDNCSTNGVGRPQELITEQTLKKYRKSLALVVGIMWQRFGTPTGNAESGTEEEFRWAMKSHQQTGFPEIKWFFRVEQEVRFPAEPTAYAEAMTQWEKVCAFRKEMEGLGNPVFYGKYQDGQFSEVLRKDLNLWLSDPQRPWVRKRRQKNSANRAVIGPNSSSAPSATTRAARKPAATPEPILAHHADAWLALWDRMAAHHPDGVAPDTAANADLLKPSEKDNAESHRFDCYVPPAFSLHGPLKSSPESTDSKQPQSAREEFPVPGDGDAALENLLGVMIDNRLDLPSAPKWLKAGRSLVITDRAGAGKTVVTWRLCSLLASPAGRRRFFSDKAPLVVRLEGEWPRRNGQPLSLRQVLANGLQVTLSTMNSPASPDDVIEFAITQRLCVLIVDGFDQMSVSDQTVVLQEHTSKDGKDGCHWIIASRLHAVDRLAHSFNEKHWQRVSIEPFDQQRQDDYFRLPRSAPIGPRWLRRLGIPESPQTNQDRRRAAAIRKEMQDLLQLPLVLALIRIQVMEDAGTADQVLSPILNLSDLFLRTAHQLLSSALTKSRISNGQGSPQTVGSAAVVRLRLSEHRQLEVLQEALSLIAFEMAIRGFWNGGVGANDFDSFAEACEQRYCREQRKKYDDARGGPDEEKRQKLLQKRKKYWKWSLGILRQIELNHRAVTEHFLDKSIAFRSLKIMELYAAVYLTRYAGEDDLFDPRATDTTQPITAQPYAADFVTDPKWSVIWKLVIDMPVQPASNVQAPGAKPAVMLRALSALFRPPKRIPKRDLRPTELMYRAWHRLEYLPELARHRLYWDTTAGRWLFGRELEEQGQLESRAQRLVLPGAAAVMAEFRKSADELRKEFAQPPQPVPEPGTSEHTAWLQQWATQSSRTKSGAMLQCPPQSWQAAYGAQRVPDDPHYNGMNEGLIKPQPAFRLQATTVTRRQYRVFDAALESSDVGDIFDADDDFGRDRHLRKPISEVFAGRSSVFKPGQSNDDFPVICVTWFDAWVFAKWLGPRFRLPKEHEWELACRAGTQTAYHFGDGCNGEQANCNGNFPNGTDRNGQSMKKGPYLGRTTPVGDPRYPCNAWGFWDVHGNVWEWCEEPYEENADPGDPGSVRVLRGGSWRHAAGDCVASRRNLSTPGVRRYFSGFRLRVD